MLKQPILIALLTIILTSFSINGINNSENIQKVVNTEKTYISPEEKREAYFFESYALKMYSQIEGANQIKFNIFEFALLGFENIRSKKLLSNDSLLTIVDFSKASSENRFFTIDLKNKKILYQQLVSHGVNSGAQFANNFSNSMGSRKSSLGFYLTNETYFGSNGFSLKLDGLETMFNGNARVRGIVVHGANYVNDDFLVSNDGRLGRSFGCPALPTDTYKEIIETIKGKSCFFIYAPDNQYLSNSAFINPILKSKLLPI